MSVRVGRLDTLDEKLPRQGYRRRLWLVSRAPVEGRRLHILVCGRGENLRRAKGGYHVIADERLKLLVIAHELRRHELARAPPVDVRCGQWRAGAEVLGNQFDAPDNINELQRIPSSLTPTGTPPHNRPH